MLKGGLYKNSHSASRANPNLELPKALGNSFERVILVWCCNGGDIDSQSSH